jgi:hypothetical protein
MHPKSIIAALSIVIVFLVWQLTHQKQVSPLTYNGEPVEMTEATPVNSLVFPAGEGPHVGTGTTTYESSLFQYVFEYPTNITKEPLPGKDGSAFSDYEAQITMYEGEKVIFNVTRLYLDEKTIQKGIADMQDPANIDGWLDDSQIQAFKDRIDVEFASDRKYRDMPSDEFLHVLSKELSLRGSVSPETSLPYEKTEVDSILAYEFTWTNDFPESNTIPYFKLGYGFVSDMGFHKVVYFESLIGEKFFIHYIPNSPISLSMFKSFHFVQ